MIQLRQVTAGYPGKIVLRDFSLTLPDSGAIAVMAPSGYGKTTFLRLLSGLLAPLSGSISGLEGKRAAYLFQEDRLLPWLTAEKNVEIVSGPEPAHFWLEQMEITDGGQYPRAMSGGMQRRVALARAMAYGGDILLLDEPFKGLDEALRSRIAARIRGQFPLTVLSVHDAEEARLMDALIVRLDQINSENTQEKSPERR